MNTARANVAVAVLLSMAASHLNGQTPTSTLIKTDGSWGRTPAVVSPVPRVPPPGGTRPPPGGLVGNRGQSHTVAGQTYLIKEADGRVAGNNLFHSFEAFSVGANDAAVFSTTTPTLQNVVSRVTGASPTTINGLLLLQPAAGSQPNFFFVNPNGVTFGPGSAVDVPAAFHVSTASNLAFSDGTIFRAGNGSDSTLTIAAPEAFGFVGREAAVTLGVILPFAPPFTRTAPISLIATVADITAPNILMENALLPITTDLQFRAVGTSPLSLPVNTAPPLPLAGNIEIKNGTIASRSGADIFLSAGNLTLSGSQVSTAAAFIDPDAGRIHIDVANRVLLQTSVGSDLTVIGSSDGRFGAAGTIDVTANEIVLNKARIGSIARTLGQPADVTITARQRLALDNYSLLSIDQFSNADPTTLKPTRLAVRSPSIELDATSRIETRALWRTAASNLSIRARDDGRGDLLISSTSQSTISSIGGINGAAGALEITADHIDIADMTLLTSLSDGIPGDLSISAKSLSFKRTLLRGGSVSLSAGDARIAASQIGADGHDGVLRISAGNLTASDSQIFAITESDRHAASIALNVDDKLILQRSHLGSTTLSVGRAGNINVKAREIVMEGSEIYISAREGTSGQAGSIKVTAPGSFTLIDSALTVENYADVSDPSALQPSVIAIETPKLIFNNGALVSNTLGNARGSDIVLSPLPTSHAGLSITGGFIQTNSFASGDGGNVLVSATDLEIFDTAIDTSGGALLDGGASLGSAGDIRIDAKKLVLGDSMVSTTGKLKTGHGGEVRIAANDALIRGSELVVGTMVQGNGNLQISANTLTVIESVLSSGTDGVADGGEVILQSNKLSLARSNVVAETSGVGAGGRISINADSIQLDNASVSSSTWRAGRAGDVELNADRIAITNGSKVGAVAEAGSFGQTGSVNVTALELVMREASKLTIENNAIVSEPSTVQSRTLLVIAPKVALTEGSVISAETTGNVAAGKVSVRPSAAGRGNLIVGGDTTGEITSSTTAKINLDINGEPADSPERIGTGAAGDVMIEASNLTLSGISVASAAKLATSGAAGTVSLLATGNLSVINGSRVATDTGGEGSAGNVTIVAANLLVDHSEVSTNSLARARGNAGVAVVSVSGRLTLGNGAEISSSTHGAGRAGNVEVHAQSIGMSGGSKISAVAEEGSSGQTGGIEVTSSELALHDGSKVTIENNAIVNDPSLVQSTAVAIVAPSIVLAGNSSISAETSGNITAGRVEIKPTADAIGKLLIKGDATGEITSSTATSSQSGASGVGVAGDVILEADHMILSGVSVVSEAKAGTTGGAGTVSVRTTGDVAVLNNSRIATNTAGTGNAGNVHVAAANLLIDPSEISSNALPGSSGDAGAVSLEIAQILTLIDGGVVSTSTQGLGRAGAIQIHAHDVLVDGPTSGIRAVAGETSSGQSGDVSLQALHSLTMRNGAAISIQNDASPATSLLVTKPSSLLVSAPEIRLEDARISAGAGGTLSASNIAIEFSDLLSLKSSQITTEANQGDGGRIVVGSGDFMRLDNSQITTSVLGGQGNGGDIVIRANTLLLETGFIQANTAAAGATGGNVTVDVQTLLPSGNSLLVGSSEPVVFQPGVFGLNVIQAAAPNGVSGTIDSTLPPLDLSGNLKGLSASLVDFGGLGQDMCRVGVNSSFTLLGRGGMRPLSTGMIRPDGPIVIPDIAQQPNQKSATVNQTPSSTSAVQ